MPELRNPRHERFAQRYLELGNASEAYRRAGYTKEWADGDGCRLLGNPSVKARIEELRALNCLNSTLKREQLEGYYSAVILTPVGSVTPNHPLAQSYEVTDKGTKVRLPDKNAAAQGLARLNGWDAPAKVEISIDPMSAYLRQLRNKAMEGEIAQVHDDKPLAP